MNPFVSIWLSPRQTVREVWSADPLQRVLLMWAWGAAYALNRAVSSGSLASWPFVGQLLFPCMIGLLGGPLYFYSVSFTIDVTRSRFAAKGSLENIRGALVLGGIPKACSLAGYAILAFVFGPDLFLKELPDDYSKLSVAFYLTVTTLMTALSVWGVVITANTLAEVQGYRSAWKAYLHIVVAYLLVAAVLAIPFLILLLYSRST